MPLDTSGNQQKSSKHALSYFVTKARFLALSTKMAGCEGLNLSKSLFRSVKMANTTICRKTKPQKTITFFYCLAFCLPKRKNIHILILSSVFQFSGSCFSGFSKKFLANYSIAKFALIFASRSRCTNYIEKCSSCICLAIKRILSNQFPPVKPD